MDSDKLDTFDKIEQSVEILDLLGLILDPGTRHRETVLMICEREVKILETEIQKLRKLI